MQPFSHLIAMPGLRAAVEAALDAGIRNTDAFEGACRPAWELTLPVREVRHPNLVVPGKEDWDGLWQACKAEKPKLQAGGRGDWMVIEHRGPHGRVFCALMHDGHGRVRNESNGWLKEATFNAMASRMISLEIWEIRRVVETERKTAAALAKLAEMRLEVGMKLRAVQFNCYTWSSGIVTSVDPETGDIGLALTRRGSARRSEFAVSAADLSFAGPARAAA
ncbi:hypothetical protein [Rhodanobacter sp. FW106-PBR-LB-2-11]|uniref:hypothetical protein n=1 Tax=Rhodanobacter sp. FW106-PBR-LB-2-11 TaxID=1524463 RepID=UPI0034E5C422